MWQPSGRPNNATVRCVCRHTPLYVGICCNALLRPTSLGARHKTGDWPKNKSPARAGALTGARGALGLEGGPLSLEQHRRSDVVPIENRNSASAGRSRHPSALAPHSAFPRSPPVWMNGRLERWRKGVRKQKKLTGFRCCDLAGHSGPPTLFKELPIYEQSAARTVREQQEKRTCVWSRQPLKIEHLHEAAI
jgi:hypothetical protein